MSSLLITAFEPYDRWDQNSSWLTLMELVRELPASPVITTRRYPVDFSAVRSLLGPASDSRRVGQVESGRFRLSPSPCGRRRSRCGLSGRCVETAPDAARLPSGRLPRHRS